MPASGEVRYTFRIRHPDVLERGRAQRVTLEAYIDGNLAAPTAEGSTFQLQDAAGDDVVATAAITGVADDVAYYDILAASLPSTLELGRRYLETWSLVMPDGTTRTRTREAAITRFQWSNPVCDDDLLAEYSGLLTDFGGVETSLQRFLDLAADQFLRRLWRVGEWPDIIVSISDTFEPVRELALMYAFKDLYRAKPTDRAKTLWDHHRDAAAAAFTTMTYEVDRDLDGLADDDNRSGPGRVIHRNAAPRRSLARSGRW